MSSFEKQILKRVTDLEKTVEQLKSEKYSVDRALEFERLPDSATVGKDYVAYRFKTSEESVMRGRAGTHLLRTKRVSEKPLKWLKRDVDAAFREYTESTSAKAAKERSNAKPIKRRKSVIPKNNTEQAIAA